MARHSTIGWTTMLGDDVDSFDGKREGDNERKENESEAHEELHDVLKRV